MRLVDEGYVMAYPEGVRVISGDTDILVSLCVLEKLTLASDLTKWAERQIHAEEEIKRKRSEEQEGNV